MGKKWVCDKCGKEFNQEYRLEGKRNLWELRYNDWIVPIAEVCGDCRQKLDNLINKFFGKTVVKLEETKL